MRKATVPIYNFPNFIGRIITYCGPGTRTTLSLVVNIHKLAVSKISFRLSPSHVGAHITAGHMRGSPWVYCDNLVCP